MIDAVLLQECVELAKRVDEEFRQAAFDRLLQHALQRPGSMPAPIQTKAVSGVYEAPGANTSFDLASILTSAKSQTAKLLAAISILEGESGDGAWMSDLPDVFKRYRLRPPGNISRDVAGLIRANLVIEQRRDGRRIQIILSQRGLAELERMGNE